MLQPHGRSTTVILIFVHFSSMQYFVVFRPFFFVYLESIMLFPLLELIFRPAHASGLCSRSQSEINSHLKVKDI